MKVACVGECMVELAERPDGAFARGFGGDTLNTAIYLARLGIPVDYVTALGDDPFSIEMLAAWQAEGVGTGFVQLVAGALPGLYLIQTDASGERRFSHWRDSAPVRRLFSLPRTAELLASLAGHDALYLSGITLSLFGSADRDRLFGALDRARAEGCRVAFDTNFRPRGWPDIGVARDAYAAMLRRTDIAFGGLDDLGPLFGFDETASADWLSMADEAVLKLPDLGSRILGDEPCEVAAEPVAAVIDTTAAGDSFAAGYLAARLRGATPPAAARAGHRLAGIVVGHRGAIVPRDA